MDDEITPAKILQEWVVGNTEAVAVALATKPELILEVMTYINTDQDVRLGVEERCRIVASILRTVRAKIDEIGDDRVNLG